MKPKDTSPLAIDRKTNPESEKKIDENANPNANRADPVAAPVPPMDGKKPISSETGAVEKFLVSTDTNGGD